MKEIGDSVKHVDQLIEDFELFEEKGKVSGLASKRVFQTWRVMTFYTNTHIQDFCHIFFYIF